jgi:hypothetical protein
MVQMNCPKGHIADNLAEIDRGIGDAVAQGADIIVFPEMSLTGYIDPQAQPEAILTTDSDPVSRFCAMTEGTSVAALAGIVERNQDGKPFITQVVAADGELLGIYRKVNVADDELPRFDAATDTPLFTHRGIRFGVALCADVGHAGLFAAYAEQGAELVLVGAAPGLFGPQETGTGRRASTGGRRSAAAISARPPQREPCTSPSRPRRAAPPTRTSLAADTSSRPPVNVLRPPLMGLRGRCTPRSTSSSLGLHAASRMSRL